MSEKCCNNCKLRDCCDTVQCALKLNIALGHEMVSIRIISCPKWKKKEVKLSGVVRFRMDVENPFLIHMSSQNETLNGLGMAIDALVKVVHRKIRGSLTRAGNKISVPMGLEAAFLRDCEIYRETFKEDGLI